MKLNYKIKKGHVSYLWRGKGSRLNRYLFKKRKDYFIKVN